jgi:hypothetical protein
MEATKQYREAHLRLLPYKLYLPTGIYRIDNRGLSIYRTFGTSCKK